MGQGSCWEFDVAAWHMCGGPRPGMLVRGFRDDETDERYTGVRVGEAVVPFGRGSNKASAIIEAGQRAELLWAKTEGGVIHRAQEEPGAQHALILVDIDPGEGGAVEFRSCLRPQRVDLGGGRTSSVFPTFPPPGVRVLCSWGPQRLLEVDQDARFKIDRGGSTEDEPDYFELNWTGYRWRTRARPAIRLNRHVRI